VKRKQVVAKETTMKQGALPSPPGAGNYACASPWVNRGKR